MFVHNNYGAVSGEERMIERIVELLRENGHDVQTFFRSSSSIRTSKDKAHAFFSGIWSRSAAIQFREEVDKHRPDIIQIQNLFPLISPSVLSVANHAGVPVVMRLSNYRLLCPNGLLMTKGQLCEKCVGGNEFWCVLRNCEGDVIKSMGYSLRSAVARKFGFYHSGVSSFYAQTEFQKNLHVQGGFSPQNISVIPNFLSSPEIDSTYDVPQVGEYVGYAGRLSPEKGVDVLLSAAEQLPSIPFRLAGHKGLYANKKIPENVQLCGHLQGEQLVSFYQNSRFIVLPSIWYEGFPGVALDSMLSMKPVIASNLGGIPEIVEHQKTGILFKPFDVQELCDAIELLWNNEELALSLGRAGRKKLMEEYTRERYYERLMNVYEECITNFRACEV